MLSFVEGTQCGLKAGGLRRVVEGEQENEVVNTSRLERAEIYLQVVVAPAQRPPAPAIGPTLMPLRTNINLQPI